MKPELLFISRKWPPAVGGMETYSVELCTALEANFRVTKLVLAGRRDGSTPSLIGYGWFLVKVCLYCLLRARRFPYLVIGDILMFPAALCCCATRRLQRRLVVVYGLDLVYGTRPGIRPHLYATYLRTFRACRGIFDNIVAISSYTAGLATQAGFANVTVINPAIANGAEIETRHVDPPREFALAGRRILQFGRLVPRKGALWFASSVLPELPDDVEFFVAGPATDGGYVDALRALPRTHYLGIVDTSALQSMIRTADVVVMPNTPTQDGALDVEGFGLVATETSSLGGILVASRFQGIADAVLDGVTGTLVDPGDTVGWQQAIRSLFSESEETRRARRQQVERGARDHFSLQRMQRAFVELLLDEREVGARGA